MLSCVLDGKDISYYSFVGDDEDEKITTAKKIELKGLSDSGKLHCKGCGAEVRLVDAEKKRKHFRHLRTADCTYDIFARERKPFEDIKLKFYNELKRNNHTIILDKRLENGSWVDIAFEFNNGRTVVLNFIKRSFDDIKLRDLHEKYREMGLLDLWVIIGEPSVRNSFTNMFTKDAMLLQGDWQDCVIYASDTVENVLTVKIKTERNLRNNSAFAYKTMMISDFSVNDLGRVPCIEDLTTRTNAEIMLSNLKYSEEQEQKRLALAKAEEERLKRMEMAKQEEEARKAAKAKKQEDKKEELHQSTGMFLGTKIKGQYELIPLEKIKLPPRSVEMTEYTKEMFEEKLEMAFKGYASPIKNLIMKLAQASDEEKDLYLSLMAQYRSLPKDDERFRILAHISIESGLRKYKSKKGKL